MSSEIKDTSPVLDTTPNIAPESTDKESRSTIQNLYETATSALAASKRGVDRIYVKIEQASTFYKANKLNIGIGVGIIAGISLTIMFNSLLYKVGIKSTDSEKLNAITKTLASNTKALASYISKLDAMSSTLDKVTNLLNAIQENVAKPIVLTQGK